MNEEIVQALTEINDRLDHIEEQLDELLNLRRDEGSSLDMELGSYEIELPEWD